MARRVRCGVDVAARGHLPCRTGRNPCHFLSVSHPGPSKAFIFRSAPWVCCPAACRCCACLTAPLLLPIPPLASAPPLQTTPPQVFYNGQRLKVKTFQDYVDMYLGPKDGGVARVYERFSDRGEVCVATTEGQFNQVGGRVCG